MLRLFKYIVTGALVMAAFMFVSNAYAGKMELTTYYPSPHGEYKDVKTSGSLTIPAKTVGTDTSKVRAGEIWFETP